MADSANEAEDTQAAEGAAGDKETPPIVIAGQYTKDLSFEVPGAPKVFLQPFEKQPNVELNLDVQVEALSDTVFEVTLNVKADCKNEEITAYIAELKYSGIFNLSVPEKHKAPVLFVECARLLFPFVRNILAEVTRDGGFQPLLLGPVDFAAIYQENAKNIQTREKDEQASA